VKRFNLSERTIEKHRRYIVSLTLILSGDYPGIQAFLPRGGDTE
jgi:RNA polymerase sigma factor